MTRADQKDDYSGRTDVSVMRPTWSPEKRITAFETRTLRETTSHEEPDVENDGVRLITIKSVAVPNS